jgi:DNA invertase Pin-like site-specific DNA recombinase
MGHLLGYARVSTTDQQPQLQVDALERTGCYRVFTETASGARSDRPTLGQVLDQLRPSDTLVVWKLDRLGRSLRHLVDTVTGLADRGVGFRSLRRRSTPPPPGGQLVFHVFAALAEFERDLIRERTTAGLAAAHARGRRGGRPSVMTAHKVRVAQRCTAPGSTPWRRSPRLWESAAPRSIGTSLTPTATNLTVRPKPWTLACECALKEVRSPGESVGKGR